MTVERASQIILMAMKNKDHLIAKTQLLEVMAAHVDASQRPMWRTIFKTMLENIDRCGSYADTYFNIEPYNKTHVKLVHYADLY